MNRYKFLKSINDTKAHHVKDPRLNNKASQFLLELDRQKLIKVTLVYLSDGQPGIGAYWITDKGIDYLDKYKQAKKDTILKFVIPIFSFLFGLLSHYIFKLF